MLPGAASQASAETDEAVGRPGFVNSCWTTMSQEKMLIAGIKQVELVMLHKKSFHRDDWEPFLAGISRGKTAIEYGANRNIFSQGDPADSVFYLRRGKVKLAVTSEQGREAIVAILGDGEFFGEGCLAGQLLRIGTATAIDRLHSAQD